MHDHKSTVVVFFILLVAVVFVIVQQRVALSDMKDTMELVQQDLARERVFAEQVFTENQQIRAANNVLRSRVIQLEQNLSLSEMKVFACVGKQPLPNMTPKNRVDLSDLHFTERTVVLNIDGAMPGVIAPSNSMAPLLSADNVVLEKVAESPGDVFVGDIIIFEQDGIRIIHRVIEIGWDESGWYAITKGDNNPQPDSEKVRFGQIRGLVVGIVY